MFQKTSTLRNIREAVVGVERIKGDPMEKDREELEQYEKALQVVKASVNRFNKALKGLNEAHAEMNREVKIFYQDCEDIDERKNIDSLVDAVRSIDEFYESGQETVQSVNQKVDALLAMHASLGSRLRDRDKAYSLKMHYSDKMNQIKETASQEKVKRNVKKQEEANDEFTKIEESVMRESQDALVTKYKDLDQVLGLYSKYLIQYFAGIGGKFEQIDHLPSSMMTSQVVRRRGKGSQPMLDETVDREELPAKYPSIRETSSAAPVIQAPQTTDSAALRSALGLRIQQQAQKDNEEGDSDLATPPI